jgi:hypothetical protein
MQRSAARPTNGHVPALGDSVTRSLGPSEHDEDRAASVESKQRRPGVCPRCGAFRDVARWCDLCGLDFRPDEPRSQDAASCAALMTEQRWLSEHSSPSTPEPDEPLPPPTSEPDRSRERGGVGRELGSTTRGDLMVGERLHELDRGSGAWLRFLQRSSYPREEWVLHQAGRPVAAVRATPRGWSVTTPPERWRAAVRRRPCRLGWQLEFTRSKEAAPALCYRPGTLLAGGTLVPAVGGRYKLRGPLLLRDEWTLASARDGELVRITTKQLRAFTADADRHMILAFNSLSEPDVLPLACAACLAILIHDRQPVPSSFS